MRRLLSAVLAIGLWTNLAPAVGNETAWDRVANIKAAATRMAQIHKEAGFFGGFDEVKKCYAEAKLAQGYTKDLEFCMAQDYAGSHAAAATYSSVSAESLRLSGSPAPEAVMNGMRDRITEVFQRLRIPQAEGMAFSRMLREHALPTYAQARFQDK